ncbi:MAG: hypothetical protein IJ752_03320 [Alphaproteobacteria bacterium]|nr:hypothetical protein [Alphaproteobacteria bacterium]
MFLFRKPLYAYDLYAFSRRLAEFRSQSVLKTLPLRFLTQPSGHKVLSDLPENETDRLTLFLRHSGVPEQTLAVYSALYPDVIGEDLANSLFQSFWQLPAFPDKISGQDQKRSIRLLKLFYALSLEQKAPAELIERFEGFLREALDFRLEAAALEQFNDAFYEYDHIHAVLPDWPKTTKNELVLQRPPSLLPLRDSPNKTKTAAALTQAVVSMLFRHGLLLLPVPAACQTDASGNLYFVRIRFPLVLTQKERFFLSSFTESLTTRNYSAAVGALSAFGYAAADTALLLEQIDQETSLMTPAEKAEAFLKKLPTAPFFMRYGVSVLKATEALCRQELGIGQKLWSSAAEELADALPQGKTARPIFQKTADQFRQIFSFAPHQLERLEMQNKKIPTFQTNPEKLSEMLTRQTIGAQFHSKRRPPWSFWLFLIVACALSAGLLFLN